MGIFQQFPYSNFHEMNLDQIIKIMREMQDEWAATKAEWASYKDFIDNYFRNLDVSEEVLAAMRIFAADGTLNTIMDPTIATETAAWLAAHITQPTSPAIDTSLSVAGAAADAKAAGDAIEYLETNIEYITGSEIEDNWNPGHYINTGTSPVDITTPTVSASYDCLVVPCDPDDVFIISGSGGSGAKLWAFIASDGTRLAVSDSNVTLDRYAITAPANTTHLVVNVQNASPYNVYQDVIPFEYLKNKQANILTDQVNYSGEILTANLQIGSLWSSTTGLKQMAGTYSCSTDLLPFNSEEDTFAYTNENVHIFVTCYDADRTFIKSAIARMIGEKGVPGVIPKETKYIGLSAVTTSLTSMSIELIGDCDQIEYPYADNNVFYIEKRLINNNGLLSPETNSYNCAFFKAKGGDVFYTNVTVAQNFCCFDSSNNVLNATYVDIHRHGRFYTLPADTAMVGVNFDVGHIHNGGSDVYYKVTQTDGILCIGDSITWLDGVTGTGYDGSSLFLGFQKQLQKAGYPVISAGFSGAAYAKDGVHTSIYTEIVENAVDVSNYDIIVLAGGTNDDLYNISVGSVPTSYTGVTYDVTTTLGALGAIIEYIRTYNADCKIVLCTQLKSEDVNRPYAQAVLYADGIAEMAKYASCNLVDWFRDMNVQPNTAGFSNYFYDSTHPTKAGMERIGKLLLNVIKNI